MSKKLGLTNSEINVINDFLKMFPQIEAAKVFGSRVLGNYKEGSDIDIAIFSKETNRRIASDFKFEIEEESDLPYFVDVVSYEYLQELNLKAHIDRFGIDIYRR